MIKVYFDSEQEWLEERKKFIGASDVGIIMGVAKWKLSDGRTKTPHLLWQEKLGLENLSCDNVATRYGRQMEEPARLVYEEAMGELFPPVCIKNNKFPHLMVSLDGMNEAGTKAVEIKNVCLNDHQEAREGGVPSKYYPQVQMQLLVTELDSIDYFSFHNGEGAKVTVERDRSYLGVLEDKLETFWQYVQNLEEPPLTDDDYILRDSHWESLAKDLYAIKRKKQEISKKEKELEGQLRNLSGDNNSCHGEFFYTRTSCSGGIDYESIPVLQGMDLNKFRKPSHSRWTIRKKM